MSQTSGGSEFQGNAKAGTGEDFGNMLAEVRAYGEAIIIAEQIPTDLVKGAIGNTFIKIMHWLEDVPSFELFYSITNLNENQKLYARTLKPGFAIVRSVYGQPVHVKVPEFGDQEGFTTELLNQIDDASIRGVMQKRNKQIGIDLDIDQAAESPNVLLDAMATADKTAVATDLEKWVLFSPMRTCLYCQGRETRTCPFKTVVAQQILEKKDFYQECNSRFKAALSAATALQSRKEIESIRQAIAGRFSSVKGPELEGMLYCFLAHEAQRVGQENGENKDRVAKARTLLRIFA
jgi:hypothetical protein